MTIKELRDNIDKINDDNLERLLQDMYDIAYSDGYEDFANKSHFEEMLENIIITDYIPIPYSVVESEE